MATLPDVQGQTQQPVPQAGGGVASYEPPNWRQVGMAGETISRSGRDLEEASNLVAATNANQDQKVAQAAGNALAQQRVSLEFDQNTGFRNAKEGQAVGQQFVDGYGTKFTDAASSIRDSLANDNQRQIFDQHAQVQGLQYKAALLAHQAQETDKFNDSTDNSSLDLALKAMATAPSNEMSFQTSLSQINGTLDSMGKRKGLPDAKINDLKAKYLDAAYSTRITSIMNGIPGVVQADPYKAEKLFEQVQGQLGVASQVHLASQVQKSIQSVQQRDGAHGLIFGQVPIPPASIEPAATGAPLDGLVKSMESGGNMNAVSSKGATSDMQVMGPTSADPGFGVRPAQPGPDGKIPLSEISRVGHDYLGAMTARYNNPALVLAAYNAGPGQTDKWIAQFGDPRTGAISTADWIAKIPFAETKGYVTKGMGMLGPMPQQRAASTANQLKVNLYSLVQASRELAEQQYPGDTGYADGMASRTENLGRMVIANQQGIEAGARDGLFSGLVGSKPDGSDKPTTIDQLLANPDMKRSWDKATPETQLAIQAHFKNGAGDPARTADTQAILYQYMGKAANDREGFASEDLSPLIATLPHADFDKLSNMQFSARNKVEIAQDKAVNLQHALSLSENYALKPMGIMIPTKDTPPAKRTAYDQFTGRLTEALDNFKTVNGKPPNDQDIVKIAKTLTANVQVPGKWYGTNSKPGFSLTPEEEARATVPMTDDQKADAVSTLTARYGFAPTDSMVQQAQILRTLHPGDTDRLKAFDKTMRDYAANQNKAKK
ncbi:LT_GEWL domain containing protein [uncultured Caudovirales phage]|uniref:LT_GEWL domain containing protein n=1 Tax=uncultured Caudovirales phage TaxID=2100421 RepID=A0A6J7WRL5_9CAUD|nr:LT_GEWL domain containing protein [uncultured Caudovirales phage]